MKRTKSTAFFSYFILAVFMPIFVSSNSSEKTEITQKYGNQTEEYAKK